MSQTIPVVATHVSPQFERTYLGLTDRLSLDNHWTVRLTDVMVAALFIEHQLEESDADISPTV